MSTSEASTLTLAAVEAAIATVLKHQAYVLMDQEYTFADLASLMKLRRELMQENQTHAFKPVRMVGL